MKEKDFFGPKKKALFPSIRVRKVKEKKANRVLGRICKELRGKLMNNGYSHHYGC